MLNHRCSPLRILGFFLTTGLSAHACDCPSPTSVDQAPATALVVFEGTVASATEKRISLSFDVGDMSYTEKTVRFSVDSLIKGKNADSLTVYFYDGREPCEKATPEFMFGQRYLISAKGCADDYSKLCNDFCSLRVTLEKKQVHVAPPPPPAANEQTTAKPVEEQEAQNEKQEKKRRGFLWFGRKSN